MFVSVGQEVLYTKERGGHRVECSDIVCICILFCGFKHFNALLWACVYPESLAGAGCSCTPKLSPRKLSLKQHEAVSHLETQLNLTFYFLHFSSFFYYLFCLFFGVSFSPSTPGHLLPSSFSSCQNPGDWLDFQDLGGGFATCVGIGLSGVWKSHRGCSLASCKHLQHHNHPTMSESKRHQVDYPKLSSSYAFCFEAFQDSNRKCLSMFSKRPLPQPEIADKLTHIFR